jgi:hypothetical protein
MLLRRFVLGLVLASVAPWFASAQSFNLRRLLVDFVENGISLEPTSGINHAADFNGFESPESQALFLGVRALNEQIATQLSSSPFPSSSGGFSYRFEPGVGFTRASESFGPIYADRTDTLGKGKLNLGVSDSHFSVDRIDGLRVQDGDIKLVFTNRDVNRDGEFLHPYYEGDLVAAQLLLKIDTNITAFVFTYGLSDRLDIGAAIPLVKVSLNAEMDAVIVRLATAKDPTIHRFPNGASAAVFRSSGSASGLGDIALRGKFTLLRGASGGLAIASEIRLPSGNERDLLGTGATQLKSLLIGSVHFGGFSPHLNAGYTWSTTPPDDRTAPRDQIAPRATIPDAINYTGGFDVVLGPRVTLAVDVIGRTLRKAQVLKVVDHTFFANTNPDDSAPPTIVQATLPRLVASQADVTTLLGSAGVKVNPFGNLLVTANALFSLTRHHGLQSAVAPFVGIDYTF